MDITDLLNIKEVPIKASEIIFSKKTQTWCTLPYPDHKSGCPNYDKSPFCPPNAPYYEKKVKKYLSLKLVIAKFNFSEYKTKMKKIHPNWSNRQLGNVLYWQSQVKRLLREYIQKKSPDLLLGCGSGIGTYSMEAVGINVVRTLIAKQIPIEPKPKNVVRLVCLMGFKSKSLLNFL